MEIISKIIIIMIILIIALQADARDKKPTYTDSNGVKRVQKTGEIYRDQKALNDFKRKNPKPDDGKAYDVDHKKPLSQGGADKPSNMQWMETEKHRQKTARENRK